MIEAITERYSQLALREDNLSCGNTLHYAVITEGMTCVDLGCGKGKNVITMAQRVGYSGFVYGIDVTPAMIEKAQEYASHCELKNVAFLLSNIEDLPIADNSIDVVISDCVLNHIENKQKAWNEIFRILKPGASFYISDIYSLQPIPAEIAENPEFVAQCWAGAITKEKYVNHVFNAGFKQIKFLRESNPYFKNNVELVSFTITSSKP